MEKTSRMLVNLAPIWVTKLLFSHPGPPACVKVIKSVKPSPWTTSTFWFFWTFPEAQRQALAQEQSLIRVSHGPVPLTSEHTTLVRGKPGIRCGGGGGREGDSSPIPFPPTEEKVSPKEGQATGNLQPRLQQE